MGTLGVAALDVGTATHLDSYLRHGCVERGRDGCGCGGHEWGKVAGVDVDSSSLDRLDDVKLPGGLV